MRSTRRCSSGRWRRVATWAGSRSPCPTRSACSGRRASRVVIVETVGVGQMEVEIASAADTTVVVVTPGWGDSMQANKAGLLEMADVFVINKSDRPGGREARRDLEQMLDLSRPGAWRPEIVDTMATDGRGGGRSLARGGPPPRPPRERGPADGAAVRSAGAGAAPGPAGALGGPHPTSSQPVRSSPRRSRPWRPASSTRTRPPTGS